MLKETLGLTRQQMYTVGGALFAYLFKRINQKQLIRYIDNKEESKRLIELIRYNGSILKNCKLYAWAWHKHRAGDFKRPNAKDYGIDLEDARFLRQLKLVHLKRKYAAFTLEDFDQLVEDVIEGRTIDTYMGKFISKKMKFLYDSYGVTRDELKSKMKEKAISTLYMQYPRYESLLHFENIAKTAIHNSGQSLITYYTAQSRQRLSFDIAEGAHQSVHALDAPIHNIEAPPGYKSDIKDYLQTIVQLSKRMKPEVQDFLMVLAGHHNPEFSRYLEADNSEVVDRLSYTRYVNKARKFFGFSETRVEKIFGRLRMHLAA